MHEFARPLTSDEQNTLQAARAEMTKKNASGEYLNKGLADLWTNRVKKASEAYQELQSLHADYDSEIVSENEDEAEEVSVEPDIPSWQTFRDNFILDWMNNRTVVSEEEADKMFERDVNDVLDEAEAKSTEPTAEQNAEAAITSTAVSAMNDAAVAATLTPKRRGRPAGTKSKSAGRPKRKSTDMRTGKLFHKAKAAPVKRAAAGKSKSSQAQTIIERYQERDWSRKDILVKLQDQLGLGAAYASTLYQKYAA